MHENEDSFCLFFSVRFYGSLFSQTTNFALRFNGDGKVDCGTISDLNNLDLYSVQCLVNPSEWVENAYVLNEETETKNILYGSEPRGS